MSHEQGNPEDDAAPVVVIPVLPGPLLRPELPSHRRQRTQREIDELFGPSVNEGPGLADLALIVVGAALAAFAALSDWNTTLLVLGVLAIGLGILLPLRSVIQRMQGQRDRRAVAALDTEGTVLVANQPEVVALCAAYDELWSAAGGNDAEVVGIAHGMLHDVAVKAQAGTPGVLKLATRRADMLRSLAAEVRQLGTNEGRALTDAHEELRSLLDQDVDLDGQAALDELRKRRGTEEA